MSRRYSWVSWLCAGLALAFAVLVPFVTSRNAAGGADHVVKAIPENGAAQERLEIHYPKSGKSTHSGHFVAFGRADVGIRPSAVVIGQDSGAVIHGRLIYLKPSKQDPSRMFWGLKFNVKASRAENYTLKIYNEANRHELAYSMNVEVPCAKPINPFLGSITIDYPQESDNPLPLEFIAFGSALAGGGDVSGEMSDCDTPPTDIEPIDPPPDWMLYCYIVDPYSPCTLTVTQGTDSAQSGDLTFSDD